MIALVATLSYKFATLKLPTSFATNRVFHAPMTWEAPMMPVKYVIGKPTSFCMWFIKLIGAD